MVDPLLLRFIRSYPFLSPLPPSSCRWHQFLYSKLCSCTRVEGDSADYTKIHFPFSSVTTGSPSSSCEIIILQNKSHSEFLRVCMAYLRPLLGIKNFIKTLNENTSLFFTQCIACYRPLTMLKKNPY